MNHKFATTIFTLFGIGLVSAVLFFHQTPPVVASARTTTAVTLQRSAANLGDWWWWFSQTRPSVNADFAQRTAPTVAYIASTWSGEWGDWPSKTSRAGSAWLSDWDWQAQQDIRARMTSDGQGWTPVEGTFKRDLNWSPGWELRWWAFNWDERRVWVYHARAKSTGARYTSLVDLNTGQWQNWQSAR